MDALLMQKMECQVKNREMEELSMKKRVYMKKRVSLLVMLLALVIMGSTMSVEAAEIIDRGYCGGEGDGKNLGQGRRVTHIILILNLRIGIYIKKISILS